MRTDIYRFVVKSKGGNDPYSIAFLNDIRALGVSQVDNIIKYVLYFIEGDLSPAEQSILSSTILSDTITQEVTCSKIDPQYKYSKQTDSSFIVEIAYHPGVTDPVAEQIIRAAHVMGIKSVQQASTGQGFILYGDRLSTENVNQLAARFLSNATIQNYTVGEITPVFPIQAEPSGVISHIPINSLNKDELIILSKERRAALDLTEMVAIQDYFRNENREITDIEFETLAQTWSEHCVHKTFKALITLANPEDSNSLLGKEQKVINGLLNTYLRSATDQINPWWLRSAFVDNAGIVDFDMDHEASFKVETHNHPSAIEPFGGANTGVGGVIRDVIGVSAKPIAVTDVLCFGTPDQSFDELPGGVLHPRRIRSGVIAGIQDYGNKIGIPTVSGAILYDQGFTANPLVFCGCVGIAPKNSHSCTPLAGDRVILLGGKTGRDGLRGATFSSMPMDAHTGQVAGASVQIGAPIIEKGLIDVILLARDMKLYHAITDCGAGGLSSAVGEMASNSGADIDLNSVSLKYSGLAPWEIWLSEAQERMILAVSSSSIPQLKDLCHTYDVEFTDMGSFTNTGRLVVRYGIDIVLDLKNSFLHNGIPQRKLTAILPYPPKQSPGYPEINIPEINIELAKTLFLLLSHPNIASKESVIRIYDHEVQGGTVIKPFVGAKDDGPSDAVVIKPYGTNGNTAIVLGVGINPSYGKHNSYRMAVSVVDEAIRNVICVGGNPDRIALLDNFCWGDPNNPETLGTLVEAVRGCFDAAIYFQTPFISGKDSLNNEYMGTDGQRHSIPPTLLISSIGIIGDLHQTVTMDFKEAGNPVYRIGDFQPCFQGSYYSQIIGHDFLDGVPGLPKKSLEIYRILYQAINAGWVKSCHDVSEGGLLVTAAEMCIGSRLGLDLSIDSSQPALFCFGETNGCILTEVSAEFSLNFEKMFTGFPLRRLGTVRNTNQLSIYQENNKVTNFSIDDLIYAWKTKN